MRRLLSVLGLSAIIMIFFAAAAAAQGGFADTDGDGIPDPPEGEPGDLDVTTGGEIISQLQDQVARAEELQDADTGAFITGICGGMAVSYDPDGNPVDAIFRDKNGGPIVDWDPEEGEGLGPGMTSDNPFVVDSRGEVVYYGELENAGGEGPRDHEWAIKTGGISLDAGGDDNPDGNNRNAGIADLGSALPVPITGTVKVTGTLTSQNGADCEGAGFVQFVGPPGIATPIGAGGAALAGIGIVGLLFNSRPAITWRA